MVAREVITSQANGRSRDEGGDEGRKEIRARNRETRNIIIIPCTAGILIGN